MFQPENCVTCEIEPVNGGGDVCGGCQAEADADRGDDMRKAALEDRLVAS